MADMFNMFVKGPERKTKRIQIQKDASVDELLNKISKINGIPIQDQKILYTSCRLEYGCGKYLSDYEMTNGSTVYVVLLLEGSIKEFVENSENHPPIKEIADDTYTRKRGRCDVSFTDDPDMITLDDDPYSPRIKMSCGHSIGPESLKSYCQSLLDGGQSQFVCPYIDSNGKCGERWPFFLVRRLVSLTAEEITEFESKLCENYTRKTFSVQECPGCHSVCERKKSTDRRVLCPWCSRDGSRYEFCWSCLHTWTGNGTCGNSDCPGEDPRQRILRDAPKKTVDGVASCPSRRACPACWTLIEHVEACRQIICPCGQTFCFICLTKANANGSFPRGSHVTCCIAAIQEVVSAS
ncbi:probable E3 ubiquitin-protein ligase ARI1 [Gigantopelta aegis]|uniref:probable E3 ubiquitin-protein ligase ARI1 n=1 Tax=Gigantopelta aegis TaxID=1735272 RepID=UPI001B8882A2|nr:probable E3 ubiquitin-protein ligase ARI1 [Gigantopelta aegis]